MPATRIIKPTHKAIKQYHQALKDYQRQRVIHEGASGNRVSAPPGGHGQVAPLHAYPQAENPRRQKQHLPRRHGARHALRHAPGLLEAKDTDDDLDKRIAPRSPRATRLNNTIFEDTRRAVLFQGGNERYRFDITDKKQIAALLNEFYAYTEPEIENFQQAA